MNCRAPGADGSLNPPDFDKVENLTIFYVERGFKGNSKQIDESIYDPAKLQDLKVAEQEYSIAEKAYNLDPSPANLSALQDAATELQNAQREYESSGLDNTFYYDQAQPVHILGTAANPAWELVNSDSSLLVKVDQDDNGRSVPLFFRYLWKPDRVREGDYFICWTWIPSDLAPAEKVSANLRFWLNGNTQITTAIPSHFTNPDKYPTLLERYTPELFKLSLTDDDRSPDVIDKFNQSVALGFQNLEDLANQIVDLLDANAIHESLIPYLSNIFGLKLKSTDPTKWRAQIKRAVPLYKGKGTRSALNEAFLNSSMELLDLTIPWQIVSSYTWQESFVINQSDNFSWTAKFPPTSIVTAWVKRKVNNYEWEELSIGFVDYDTLDKQLILSYVAIDFTYGVDEIRFLYRFGTPPDEELEDYLLSLPLMDTRDDHTVKYPYQNWNVRLIEETDPFFDNLVPQKQPFHSPIVFGKIRTEFPYSENVYNMEEYNGSNRDSKVPCDIDRFFRDECSACRSSCYNVDIEIENLSDDRVYEAKDILKEFMPFHAMLHSVNFRGAVNDFTQSPVETINLSIIHDSEQNVIHNQSQFWFNRVSGEFSRNELALFDSFNPIYNISEIATSGPSTTEITISNLIITNEVQEDAGGDTTSDFTLDNTNIISESPTGTIYDGTTAVATFTVDSLGNLVLTEIPVTPIGTNNVYIFTNSYYVWYANNLTAFMTSVGISYQSFTDLSEASWINVAANADIIIIPRIEPNEIFPDLSSSAKTVIESFVANGGTLIFIDPFSSDVVDWMTEIFGQFIDTRTFDDPYTLTDEGACLIPGLTATLDQNGYVYPLDSNPSLMLPGSISIYKGVDPIFPLDPYQPTVAVQMPYNDGKIYMLCWDWYDSAPLGALDGGWNNLLQSILELNISTTPNPNVLSGTLNYTTGEVSLTWSCDPGPNSIEISYEVGHNLLNGDYVYIDGSDSEVSIDGFWQITYIDENTFSIETDTVTVAGEIGTITKAEYESLSATGYNDDVMVFCPATRLDTIGMMPDSSARMQILAPSGLVGFYTVKDPVGKTMIVELDSGVPTPQSEPIVDPMSFFQEDGDDIILNEDTFVFNVFNIVADGEGLCSVNQDNVVMFGDENNDFRLLSIETNRNSGTPWSITISSTDFLVEDFLPDGRLVLGEGSPVNTLQSLVSQSNVTYSIKDGAGDPVSWTNNDGNTVSSSNTGSIEVYYRGRVTPGDPTELYPGIGPMLNTIDSPAYYFFINTTEYRITGLKQDSINIFYIDEYDGGDLGSSVNLRINKRVLTNEIGYFSYQGMNIQADGDLETDLGIQDGANSLVPEDERIENNRFKENFLVVVDDIPYFIMEIDGNNLDYPGKTIISLSGLRKYWRTIDAGGTPINFSIRNYVKQDVSPTPIFSSLPLVNIEDIDRAGESIYEETTLLEGLSALADESGPVDFVQQLEKVSFKIEYKKDETN